MERKNITAKIVSGAAGGAFIAAGSLSAIGFTGSGAVYGVVIAFVIIGALLGIILDTCGHGVYALFLLSGAMAAAGRFLNLVFLEYMASGAVMYMGCVLALPESDIFTNAVTGAAAAAGFLTAVTIML